jgi:hypothetical protein
MLWDHRTRNVNAPSRQSNAGQRGQELVATKHSPNFSPTLTRLTCTGRKRLTSGVPQRQIGDAAPDPSTDASETLLTGDESAPACAR